MKKAMLSIVLVISLLAVMVSTVSATSKTATLATTEYIHGKGVVMTFDTTGTFTKADLLKATVVVNHQLYKMHCLAKGDKQVVCEAPGTATLFHGYKAAGQLDGFGFATMIPKETHKHDHKGDVIK